MMAWMAGSPPSEHKVAPTNQKGIGILQMEGFFSTRKPQLQQEIVDFCCSKQYSGESID